MHRATLAVVVLLAAALNALAFVAIDARATGLAAWVAAGATGIGIAGIILMGVARAMRISPSAFVGPLPTPSHPDESAEIGVAVRDRDTLVAACIEVADAVPSQALRERLVSALSAAGVVAIRSDGEVFDPARQVGVDRVATSDPTLHGRVAATELPGYVDRGTMLRRPHVTVFRDGGDQR